MAVTGDPGGRVLRDLPKAHLHVHLDGGYPRDAVRRLARRRGLDFTVPDRFTDVWEFFAAYGTVPALVQRHEELAELCRALVFAEAADGVCYLEPAVEPQLFAGRLGGLDQVLATMCAGFAEAATDTGIEVGAMVTVNTDTDLEISEELARIAARRAGAGVVALGTAGFVEPAGLARYAPAARIATTAGLEIVCHAGQTGGPDSVREALDTLRPGRIAHGIHAAHSPELMARLAAEGICCDVAPVSNVELGVVADLGSHPAPVLVAHGVPVTLNADDPLWFGASATDQYEVARRHWGFDDATLAAVAANGARAAGMTAATRQRLRTGVREWLAADPGVVRRAPTA
jgi:adenosine deaminase